tara:strand:+ start:2309 stop:5734 length:3426 start_codon:yes stop_codon:yes gene_type:complete
LSNFSNNLFIHLRVHSAYSLSFGALQIDKIIDLAKNDNQPAICITDNNNMFGALEFSEKASSNGIQPIIGCQLDIIDEYSSGEVVLIAKDERGYLNLINLVSNAHLNSNELKGPVVKINELKQRNHGLIVLSGGPENGFISQELNSSNKNIIKSRLDFFKINFDGNFYIELQRHNKNYQKISEKHLIELAYKHELPLVATNDVCFLEPEMQNAHEVLMCIEAGLTISNPDRKVITPNHYFKNMNEMIDLFNDIPEAISNTINISRRCHFRPKTSKPMLPAYETISGKNEKEELKNLSEKGLKLRLNQNAISNSDTQEIYKQRLDKELKIICDMGFAGYYLIVSDVVNWAKDSNIPVGPGRGSGAGSIVAWCLKITDLDPIRWGLLFERFLNPERISMPDFDIDFCKSRRDEIIEYVQKRYGFDKVAQIITFGELKSRAVIRDTGRVLEMPYNQVDRIAKLIPNNPARPLTISQAINEVDELQMVIDNDEQVKSLIEVSQKIEGLFRHASTHAAGIVIGHRKISDIVPLYRDPKSEMPATQFNMKWVEKAGLVKFDFLGLQTLTMIKKTIDLLKLKDINVNFNEIPLTDRKTFDILSEGKSLGIFQLESGGMKEVLKGLKPDRFEDIIAIVALYRPGPMENIPTYISRKHGVQEVEYMHPDLEGILKETFGIMIYQEQVQQAAQILAGYSLGAADILRRAMGKKIKSEMDAQREKFVAGANNKSISSKLSNKIFDQISAFAGYGFNKSHAAGYALITYQTAWLRAHYSYEFFAASMSLEKNNTDKLAEFVIEAKARSIKINPPNINRSFSDFLVLNDEKNVQSISYGLSSIKNVGQAAIEDLVKEREINGKFLSLENFLRRVSRSVANKRLLENLIKSGSMDCLHNNRKELLTNIDNLISFNDLIKRENESNQNILFEKEETNDLKVKLNNVKNFSFSEKLENEFSALGLYLSSHPLEPFSKIIKKLEILSSNEIEEYATKVGSGSRIKLAGIISNMQMRTSKRGKKFFIIYMTDNYGPYDFLAFDEIAIQAKNYFDNNKPICVSVEVRIDENSGVRLNAIHIEDLEKLSMDTSEILSFKIENIECIDKLKEFLGSFSKGNSYIKLFIKIDNKECEVNLPNGYSLTSDDKEQLYKIKGVHVI